MYIPSCTLFFSFFFGFVGMFNYLLIETCFGQGRFKRVCILLSPPNCNTLLSHRIFYYFAIPIVLRVSFSVYTVINKKKLFL